MNERKFESEPSSSDAEFLRDQRLGGGAVHCHDPGQIEPINYPVLTDEQQLALPELARRAREARIAFDAGR
jgi:hypothetical protein